MLVVAGQSLPEQSCLPPERRAGAVAGSQRGHLPGTPGPGCGAGRRQRWEQPCRYCAHGQRFPAADGAGQPQLVQAGQVRSRAARTPCRPALQVVQGHLRLGQLRCRCTCAPGRTRPCLPPARACSYVRENKAIYKVAGFWQAQQQREAAAAAAGGAAAGAGDGAAAGPNGGATTAGTGALHALLAFLQTLTSADADGRIVVQPPAGTSQQAQQAQQQPPFRGGDGPTGAAAGGAAGIAAGANGVLKFVLLNAAEHFGEVVSAAHAVVLASGTLSPLQSVLHLFPGLPPHRLHRFSCGHVVGEER